MGLMCQFLIGKVQQFIGKIIFIHMKTYWNMCQFLIGKVQQGVLMNRTFLGNAFSCQFLIGKVQLPIDLGYVIPGTVSIPHR